MMRKQWFSTVLFETDAKSAFGAGRMTKFTDLLVELMNRNNFQPGEVILLPLVQGESPKPYMPMLYFAEKPILVATRDIPRT